MTDTTEARSAAFKLLDQAIDALVEAHRDDEDIQDDVAVDALLIVGFQAVDDDGDRVGAIALWPRHGSQPLYITHGLIAHADQFLREPECHHE